MRAKRGLFDDFVVATAVLTRLPVGAARAAGDGVAAAGWAFPLVGAGVGALCAVAYLVAQALGLSIAASSLLAVLTGVAITGAFHEDGLADTVDGFGGGNSRADKLRIMRDSRHGTYGILALVFGIGLRTAAIAAAGDPIHIGLALVAAHAVSRGALPPLMRLLPTARSDGLGAGAGRPTLVVALVAAAFGTAIGVALLGPGVGGTAVLITGAALAAAAVLARRQVGGYTGDVLGFFQQIGEIVMLLAAAAK